MGVSTARLPSAFCSPRVARANFLRALLITSSLSLFDHLVGNGEQRWWNIEAKHLGSLHVDDELKFACAQDRQVGGLFALEHASGIDSGQAPVFGVVRSIAYQPADVGKVTRGIDRRQPTARRVGDDLEATVEEQALGNDQECIGSS